jgi:hypothetical protein
MDFMDIIALDNRFIMVSIIRFSYHYFGGEGEIKTGLTFV